MRVWVTERIGFVPSDALAGLAIESVTFAISSPAIESIGIEKAAHSSGVLESMASECCNPSVKERAADESDSINSDWIDIWDSFLKEFLLFLFHLGTELLEEGKQ